MSIAPASYLTPLPFMQGDGSLQPVPEIIPIALRHRLELLLFDRLVAGHALSPAALDRARLALDEAGTANQRLLDELLHVLKHLAASNVPCIALKGPALALMLWGDLRLRRSRDVDILVPLASVADAIDALQAAGYRAPPPAGGLMREVHLHRSSDDSVVDLHWNIAPGEIPFPISFDDIWTNRRTVAYGAGTVPVVGPEWLFVIGSVYLVKDFPWPQPIYLSDLARLVARFPDINWRYVHAIATRTGTHRICAAALHLVSLLPNADVPASARRLFQAEAAATACSRSIAKAFDGLSSESYIDGDPLRRFVKLMRHGAFRERMQDKLHLYRSLLPILLFPGRTHEGQGWTGASLARLHHLAKSMGAAIGAPSGHAFGDTRPTPGTIFFPIDDCGIVLTPSQQLVSLNASAAVLWCLLEENLPSSRLIKQFAATTGRSRVDASGAIGGALTTWRSLGLIGQQPAAPDLPTGTREAAPIGPPPVVEPRDDLIVQRCYKLFDVVFDVRLPSPHLAAKVDTALAHLATTSPATARASVYDDPAGGFRLTVDGVDTDHCDDMQAVAPMVKGRLNVEAVNRQPFGLYIHAAMLCTRDGAILLPAAPHSGKTCLSAALAREGFDYCTDEITLLDPETYAARGLHTALTIKAGAWKLLQPIYPELPEIVPHRRVDGWMVKYLPPPPARGPTDGLAAVPVRAMIFPRYAPGTPTRLMAMPRTDALRQLMDECLAMRIELTPRHVSALVRWIAEVDCYALAHADLREAVGLLQRATSSTAK